MRKQFSVAALFLMLLLTVFTASFCVRWTFDFIFTGTSLFVQVFVSALILVLFLSPLLHVLVFRPMHVLQLVERRRAEDVLNKSKEKYETLVNSVDGVIWEADARDFHFTFVSPQCERMLGITPEQWMREMTWEKLIHAEDAERVFSECNEAIRERRNHVLEYRVLDAGGRVVWVKDIATLVTEKGEPVKLLGILIDITEKKHEEENQEKLVRLESLGVLAGGIAHDFNNILTAILGNVSFAKLSINSQSRTYALIDEAEKASLRAKELSRQLLTFSKGGEPVKVVTSIASLVQDAARFSAHGTRFKCLLSIPENLWFCDVDEGQLTQVVQNIVLNAGQAMPDGGRIYICCENVSLDADGALPVKPGDYVRLSVRDEGAGIPPENVNRIFEPYFTTKKKGSGLGLATTYSIVKKHGGHISAESEPGYGTTFVIYLPACKEYPVKSAKKEKILPVGNGRILVMDDEEPIRMLLQEMLEFLGYEASFAKDGQEALNLYREERESGKPFDAVLLDLTIPGGMGGKETIKKLLEIEPELKAVVSSGYSDDPVMANYKQCGFKAMIPKPYDLKKIGDVLHDVMRVNGNGGVRSQMAPNRKFNYNEKEPFET